MKAVLQLFGSLPGAGPVPGVPGPGPGPDFHPLRDPWPIAVPGCRRIAVEEPVPFAAVPFEVIPNAVPGCRRIADEAAGLPVAKAAGLPAAEKRSGIRPNEAQARVRAPPGRPSAVRPRPVHPNSVHPNSVHHLSFVHRPSFVRRRCCSPVTNPPANAAAPGRRRPAKPKA
jgi:hypothetical protein